MKNLYKHHFKLPNGVKKLAIFNGSGFSPGLVDSVNSYIHIEFNPFNPDVCIIKKNVSPYDNATVMKMFKDYLELKEKLTKFVED